MLRAKPPRRPRVRATPLRRWHLWLGLIGGVWLLWLIGTGVILGHAAALGLDRHHVSSPALLRAYGLPVPEPLQAFELDGRTLAQAGERLYLDGSALPGEYPPLVGVVPADGLLAAVGSDAVVLLTPRGRLVERLALPAELAPVRRVGRDAGGVVLHGAQGRVRADPDFTRFEPAQEAPAVRWAAAREAAAAERKTLIAAYHAGSISYARLLADLHSGRLFGPAGPLVVDALSVLLAAQVVTGFVLAWPRRSDPASRLGRRPPGI